MKSFTYTITDPIGIHARPAGLLAKEAKKYNSKITLSHGEKKAEVTKLIQLMGLGVRSGDTVTIEVEGDDADAACQAVETFLKENL